LNFPRICPVKRQRSIENKFECPRSNNVKRDIKLKPTKKPQIFRLKALLVIGTGHKLGRSCANFDQFGGTAALSMPFGKFLNQRKLMRFTWKSRMHKIFSVLKGKYPKESMTV
jgi:hypothetical protein